MHISSPISRRWFAGVVLSALSAVAMAQAAQPHVVVLATGGTLTPLMCVDKLPDELASFEALVQEAAQFVLPGQDWGLVFAAALSGTLDRVPTSSDADAPLQRMVEAIKGGAHGAYIPFDRQGQPVNFN